MGNFLSALTKGKHCWHGDNIVLTSNPPQHPQTCCHCGAKRIVTSRLVPQQGHGSFVQPVHTYEQVIRGGEGPCEPKEKP